MIQKMDEKDKEGSERRKKRGKRAGQEIRDWQTE